MPKITTRKHSIKLIKLIQEAGFDVDYVLGASSMLPDVLKIETKGCEAVKLEVRLDMVDFYTPGDLWYGNTDDDDRALEWVHKFCS